jgi:hypothetical protein
VAFVAFVVFITGTGEQEGEAFVRIGDFADDGSKVFAA